MSEYRIEHNVDGWPICKDGKSMTKKEVLAELQQLQEKNAELEKLLVHVYLSVHVSEVNSKDWKFKRAWLKGRDIYVASLPDNSKQEG